MADYFTTDHFKLLNKWKGQKRDESNPEQNQAYAELKKAYEMTKVWAEMVQEKLFPDGDIDVHRRPTSQGNTFLHYNWARIYPSSNAPKRLAFTLGIDGDGYFVVKIDTVQADLGLRARYEKVRGPFSNASPIVRLLPMSEGLDLSMEQLVDWSVKAIQGFDLSYEDVAHRIGLDEEKGDDEVLDAIASPVLIVPAIPATNRIYYGPPGTGKTFEIQRLLTLDYTTSVVDQAAKAEWTNDQIAQRCAALTWWEVLAAALHQRGGRAKVADLETHPYVMAKIAARQRHANITQSIWGTLQHHTVTDSKTVKGQTRHVPLVFDKQGDSVWFLANGWQDECQHLIAMVDELRRGAPTAGEAIKRYEFVTFHQSYGYEEFVEGLRPVLDQEAGTTPSYAIVPGVFRRLCERARRDPAHRYAMVIDEINRGNISKIFGELITLIEADKREGCEQEICVTLPYSGDVFSVPANVDIIGSMNTADRSLALLDTALRRRFEFEFVPPNPRILQDQHVVVGDVRIDLCALLTTMNQRIEALMDRDHTIGHAYLMGVMAKPEAERFAALAETFVKKIIPLLEEYFFDDTPKISLILGDNQKRDAALRFYAETSDVPSLVALFGSDHDLAEDALRPRLRLNAAAMQNPLTYVAIYQPSVATTT